MSAESALLPLVLLLVLLTTAAALGLGFLWARGRRRRWALERELEETRQALERARDARELFLDLATHELRSPLSAILGYQELLADGAYGELDEPMADAVDRIGRSARQLLHLVDGLVELSRIRSGTLRPDAESVSLGVLMASVAEAFRGGAEERGLEARVELPSSLPTIRTDPTRLVRALDLLVTSAIKHPAGRTLTLRVTAEGRSVTTRIEGTELHVGQPPDELSGDPALDLGIRLAVVEGVAGVLGGALELDESEDGTIRALSLRVGDLGAAPVGMAAL